MLPRTMSQGNDAFSSKDAERNTDESTDTTAAKREGSEGEASGSGASSTDAVDRDSENARTNRDDEAEPGGEGGDANEQDGERDADPKDTAAKSTSPRDKEAVRRRRSGGSRRSSREEEEDEREPPQTEEALNVPKMETIYMLGAISILTIILWFAAKLSCNIHPDQMRDPKHFSTRELAADPKNAAFEFHHRFETGDFTTALDLSTGEARNIVETKLKACEQDPDPCTKNQASLAGTLQSTAKLLERSGDRATVEVASESKSWPGRKSFSFEVVKEGDFWRVASRKEVASAGAEAPMVPAQAATGTPAAPAEAAPPAAASAESAVDSH